MTAAALIVIAGSLSLASIQPAPRVIVIADANAREKPTTGSRVLCPLDMGQELTLQGRDGDWVIVETCGGGAYVHAPLTRPVTSESRARVREEIIRERLARETDGFAAANSLLSLVGRWRRQATDGEAKARYALYELQALKRAADATHDSAAVRSTVMRLIGEASPVMLYNEVGGRWMLRNDYIFTVHDGYKDTAAADDIAWFAAENGLPGECEGYMPGCSTKFDMLYGEYLRRYPRGRHAAEAVIRIGELVSYFGTPPRLDYQGLPHATYCGDLRKPLEGLRQALTGAGASDERARTLKVLDQIAALCR